MSAIQPEHDAARSKLSLSDEDIEHRNYVILKEAEATWEVSQTLGITFDSEKSQLIEVFKKLEEDERRGKSPRV